MKILAIDTSAELCAACVYDDATGRELGRETVDIGKGHAEMLMPVIARALENASIQYADLERIAVSVGPGSFTGVRIGVSAARGLALALAIPAVGVTTLAGLAFEAQQLLPERMVMAVLDAKREELYAALYDPDGASIVEPMIVRAEEAAKLALAHDVVLAGSGSDLLRSASGNDELEIVSRARTADIAGYAALASRQGLSGNKPKPLYLRGADARPQEGFALPRRTA